MIGIVWSPFFPPYLFFSDRRRHRRSFPAENPFLSTSLIDTFAVLFRSRLAELRFSARVPWRRSRSLEALCNQSFLCIFAPDRLCRSFFLLYPVDGGRGPCPCRLLGPECWAARVPPKVFPLPALNEVGVRPRRPFPPFQLSDRKNFWSPLARVFCIVALSDSCSSTTFPSYPPNGTDVRPPPPLTRFSFLTPGLFSLPATSNYTDPLASSASLGMVSIDTV